MRVYEKSNIVRYIRTELAALDVLVYYRQGETWTHTLHTGTELLDIANGELQKTLGCDVIEKVHRDDCVWYNRYGSEHNKADGRLIIEHIFSKCEVYDADSNKLPGDYYTNLPSVYEVFEQVLRYLEPTYSEFVCVNASRAKLPEWVSEQIVYEDDGEVMTYCIYPGLNEYIRALAMIDNEMNYSDKDDG